MNTIRICPGCGASLPPDAPAGLCPVCLLKTDPSAKAAVKARPDEPAATLTIGPEAFGRVRYFGDYELQDEIARGGMGVVWKARQESLNRTVAVKMILAGTLAGEAEVQRFRREAEAAANLQHPNIVSIHEVGEHDGQHYYSMDYIAGHDLGALLRESGPLAPARAAECLQTIAEAVHYAHQRGTLHRDLKPQNVLMDADGVPHITDFGLAKFVEHDDSLTRTGAAMGSPSYMPPEQAVGHLDQIGPHSDVYALGAILYELLTGRPPFRAETAMATMRQVMESEPVAPRKLNPAIPPDLETICLKCLEKNPARRYSSARALAEELGRFLKHEPIQAVRASAIRKVESWLRRHPWTLTGAASLAIMVLVGLLYWQYERVKFLESGLKATDANVLPLEQRQQLQKFLEGHPSAPEIKEWIVRHHLLPGQELKKWDFVLTWVVLAAFWAGLVFSRYASGMKHWKQFYDPSDWGPPGPVGQGARIVCGLIGLLSLGVAAVYFARVIHFSVWESAPKLAWLWVYAGFFTSLNLLYTVVRDYQKFVYGTSTIPRQALSAEQSESLRQAILKGEDLSAIRLFRKANPAASLSEARDYVRKLTADLRTEHAERFMPRKPRNLNWPLMGIILAVEALVFAVFWIMMPPATPERRVFSCAAGFLFGAGVLLATRLRPVWKQFLAWILVLSIAWLVLLPLSSRLSSPDAFLGGLAFGTGMALSGFTRKRYKSAPDEHPLSDISQPH
jgi:serine/threonine protein kinase